MRQAVFFTFALLILGASNLFINTLLAGAQDLQNCYCRQRVREGLSEPRVDGSTFCLEQVAPVPTLSSSTPTPVPDVDLNALTSSADELAYTALTTDDDGTLYATRPLSGQVFAFDDSNGDFLPDRPRLVAEGLTLPNGIAYHDGALYVSGGAHLYRIPLETGEVETLVDDVPSGITGFWTGDLTIHESMGDARIYVGTGAPCDFCDPNADAANEGRGAVWSYALDGSDPQLIASGLRQPNDVAFVGDQLWTIDTARDGLDDTVSLDELNLVQQGAHFGWPYCVGADNRADASAFGSFDCATAAAPALTFPTHSAPIGLAAYRGDAFPSLEGSLLVVLYGPYNDARLQGFAVAAVDFDDTGAPVDYEIIVPSEPADERRFTLEEINYRRSGLWPNRPLDVAVDIHGWIYISILNGRIIALRQNTDPEFNRITDLSSCVSP